METGKIMRIVRIALNVADLEASRVFFERALGFREIGRERRSGPEYEALTGIAGAKAETCAMRLGGQEIELVAFSPAGRAYPAERTAADPWFQHFAIVTSDMDEACSALRAETGWSAISDGGPVLLPPEKGSIIAFKFRDPEGHPLELSWFPSAVAGPWRDSKPGRIFLGIDHAARAVADLEASLLFYTRLGMKKLGAQLNSGPTQARLDGLAGAEVEIASIGTAEPGPHIELLAYRRPRPEPKAPFPAPNDIAATRLIVRIGRLGNLLAAAASPVSDRPAMLEGGIAAIVRDPDGHLIELREY
jgi:catechol 2,3-dioxygenase-like lactoylglutathione lyase family enzyme